MPHALDLRQDVPRSPFDTLHGFMWLPRLIDKARAMHAGTLGEYTPYPCPGDRDFLKHFGLDATELGDLITSGADDETIGEWVFERASQAPDAFNQKLVAPPQNPLFKVAVWLFKLRLRKRLEQTRDNHAGIDWSQIDSLAKILVVEEGHPLP